MHHILQSVIAEALLLALAAALAWRSPAPVLRLTDGLSSALGWVTTRPWLAFLLPGLLLIALRLALLPVYPLGEITGRDESSLVLGAETLLQGRLAMPPHPMAPFFETVYVNQSPAYQSMYFPGRVIELALGQALFGDVRLGMLLMVAVAMSTLGWALRPWVSAKWALAGAIVVVVHIALFGALATRPNGTGMVTLGGVLLIGAYGRLRHRIDWQPSLALAVGLAMLAISRPLEGLMVSAPLILSLIWHWRAKLVVQPMEVLGKVALPIVVLVGCAGALLLANNLAGTGSITQAPYSKNRAEYATTPVFFFSPSPNPSRIVPEHLRSYYEEEGEWYDKMQTPFGLARQSVVKILFIGLYFIGVMFFVPFAVGSWWFRKQPAVLVSIVMFFASFLIVQFILPFYALPLLGIFTLIVVKGFEHLHAAGPKWRTFARVLIPVSAALLLVPLGTLARGGPRNDIACPHLRCHMLGPTKRPDVERFIVSQPGLHVAVVRYTKKDSAWQQWVFNGATIDQQRLIWANDLGPVGTKKLMNHYPDRRFWLIENPHRPRVRELKSP